uniref:Uncharacterized protein n=1 Tax=Rhizophora mucronata TaxID=61149 RepID=A0A2P2NRZ9_RHIMU
MHISEAGRQSCSLLSFQVLCTKITVFSLNSLQLTFMSVSHQFWYHSVPCISTWAF